MTDQPRPLDHAQLLALHRDLRRQLRDANVRSGLITPQTHREMRLWPAGLDERFGLDDPDHASGRRAAGTGLGDRPPDDHPPDAAT